MSRRRRWWRALALLPAVVVLGFVLWAATGPGPMPEALAALESDGRVRVERSRWLVFRPAASDPDVGLILYPGGRVDPRAYAPAAREIAAAGYLVAIVPMPLDLAVLAPGRAAAVMEAYPEIDGWAVGGHSLGGAMAANYAAGNPDLVQGLVLWAAYPAGGDDLSDLALAVTSIYGTEDGLTTLEDVEASRPLLPADTEWVAIEGGNHAGFGWYGPQSGDNEATIGRAEQGERLVAATLQLLGRLGE